MKFHLKCKFLAQEQVTSAKGNKYIKVLLMQGTETISIMSEVSLDAKEGTEFVAVLDYSVRFKNLKLVGVEKGGER